MLMVIAVVGAIALGEFTEAAAVVVLFSLADFLEDRCAGQVCTICNGPWALPVVALLILANRAQASACCVQHELSG